MSGRLDFDLMPDDELPQKSRRVLDAAFRSLRSVLDNGIRMREQFRCVDTVVDTAELPVSVLVEGIKAPPLAVAMLRATVQRTGTGQVISGGAVTWEWRGGALLIHAIDSLAASTRYNATFAVME